MKNVLRHAPLVHAVIHLKFSTIPALENMSSDLSKILHQKMIEVDFPEKIISEGQHLEISFDALNQQSKQTVKKINRNLYRASGEKTIVEISHSEADSSSSLILKSTEYETFEQFEILFNNLLNGCLEVIPGLNKSLLKSIGLRYVDVIVPNQGNTLQDFVIPKILPAPLDNVENLIHRFGLTIKQAQTAKDQILSITFEEIATNNGMLSKILPESLGEHDSKCGLIIEGQQYWTAITSPTYGILDIDHLHTFTGSPQLDKSMINTVLTSLYQTNHDVFWSVITETAKKAWGKEEI